MSLRESTLAHVYGVPATLLGLLGTWFLVEKESPWQQYALVASGWLAAGVYAAMLIRTNSMAREDGQEIGFLKEKLAGLERTLDQRTATLDYVAGMHIGQKATPRAAPDEGGEE